MPLRDTSIVLQIVFNQVHTHIKPGFRDKWCGSHLIQHLHFMEPCVQHAYTQNNQSAEFVSIKFEPCIHLIMVIVLHSPKWSDLCVGYILDLEEVFVVGGAIDYVVNLWWSDPSQLSSTTQKHPLLQISWQIVCKRTETIG